MQTSRQAPTLTSLRLPTQQPCFPPALIFLLLSGISLNHSQTLSALLIPRLSLGPSGSLGPPTATLISAPPKLSQHNQHLNLLYRSETLTLFTLTCCIVYIPKKRCSFCFVSGINPLFEAIGRKKMDFHRGKNSTLIVFCCNTNAHQIVSICYFLLCSYVALFFYFGITNKMWKAQREGIHLLLMCTCYSFAYCSN